MRTLGVKGVRGRPPPPPMSGRDIPVAPGGVKPTGGAPMGGGGAPIGGGGAPIGGGGADILGCCYCSEQGCLTRFSVVNYFAC